MVTKAPAYLTVRNGIFYFQLRIPAHITHSSVPSSRVIRKSTGTGNFREALRISRQWWNLIMAGDFFEETYPELGKSEQNDAMVRHGEHNYRQFKIVGVDENDHLAGVVKLVGRKSFPISKS